MTWCAYFTKGDPSQPKGIVVSDAHEAEEGLHFFVPVPGGDAVRVPVCQEHCDKLKETYAICEATVGPNGVRCERTVSHVMSDDPEEQRHAHRTVRWNYE